jgi:hypothetical protein
MVTDQFVGTTGIRREQWKDRVITQLKPVLLDFLDDISNTITGHVSERMPPVVARAELTEPGPHFDWDPVIGLEVTMHIIIHVLAPLMKATAEKLRQSLGEMPYAEEITDDDDWIKTEFQREIDRLEAQIWSQLTNGGPAQAGES